MQMEGGAVSRFIKGTLTARKGTMLVQPLGMLTLMLKLALSSWATVSKIGTCTVLMVVRSSRYWYSS